MQKNNKKLKKSGLQRYNFRVCRDPMMSVSTAVFGLLIAGGFVRLGRFWLICVLDAQFAVKKRLFVCDFAVPYG